MVSKYFKISHKYKKKSSKSLKQDGSLFFFPLQFSSINALQKVIEISLLSVSDDLVLSTELIMLPGHCKEILKLTFRALDLSFALTANLLHQLPRVITQNYLKKIPTDIAPQFLSLSSSETSKSFIRLWSEVQALSFSSLVYPILHVRQRVNQKGIGVFAQPCYHPHLDNGYI